MLLKLLKYNQNHHLAKKILVMYLVMSLPTTFKGIAQENKNSNTAILFQSEELLHIKLEADYKTVFSSKDNTTYFPASLSFTDKYRNFQPLDLKMRMRGKTRRNKNICRFAPLRLKFPKEGLEKTLFENQKILKLVTHCNNNKAYEQNTILEYLVYKSFNILTDNSLKVRAAVIDYSYTRPINKSIQKFAFFIEHDRHLAKRLGGMEIETGKIHPNQMNLEQSCLMDIFQYMIGNTDYSSYELHNTKIIIDSLGKTPPIVVPYDFDWCGLISAFYAVPDPIMNTTTVSERVYRGYLKDPEIVNASIQKFKNNKQAIYELFKQEERLEKKKLKRVINYLDDFYEIINNESRIQSEFFDNAKTIPNNRGEK